MLSNKRIDYQNQSGGGHEGHQTCRTLTYNRRSCIMCLKRKLYTVIRHRLTAWQLSTCLFSCQREQFIYKTGDTDNWVFTFISHVWCYITVIKLSISLRINTQMEVYQFCLQTLLSVWMKNVVTVFFHPVKWKLCPTTQEDDYTSYENMR